MRYLGRGGMGEVYEAEDLDLEEQVALKVVRPSLASDWTMMERFRREIQLSRRVTHPNVCRVFDLGRHRDAKRDVTFLTMELLPGETLEQRIRREGRMPAEAALPLIRQMAAGLAAAHAANVIHRDFKASNVILVPGKDGERAVVTDFGLAGNLEDLDHVPGISFSGDVMGTAAYVAPERLGGGKASAESDIYSFGVVIYEMVTGTRPHAGESTVEVLLNRVKEPLVSPKTLNAGLAEEWESAILRCLAQEPAERYSSAREVAHALEPAPSVTASRPRPEPRRSRLAPSMLLALLLATVTLPGSRFIGSGKGGSPPGPRRSVAVLGFRDLAGRPDSAWRSAGLSEMVRAELSAAEGLRVLPSRTVERMKLELGPGTPDTAKTGTLATVRASLGVDSVVFGSFLALEGAGTSPARLDLHVQDTASGELLSTVTVNSTIDGLLTAVRSAGPRLRGSLGASAAPREAAGETRRTLPADTEAARLYCQGLVALWRFNFEDARQLFRESLAIEPHHAPSHLALSEALQGLGLATDAEEEAKNAHEAARGLSREEQLFIEGRYHEASSNWDKAIEAYRVLFGFFHDDVEHGLRLAAAQAKGGDPNGARITIESLRSLPGLAASDPRIDLAEASAAVDLGDFERGLAASGAAIAKSRERGARLLTATGLLEEAHAQEHLGRYDKALERASEAAALFSDLAYTARLLTANETKARALQAVGELDRAQRIHAEDLELARASANREGEISSLIGLGSTDLQRGNIPEARARFEKARELAAASGNRLGEASSLKYLGILLGQTGELAVASERLQQSLTLFQEANEKRQSAEVMLRLGEAAREAGNMADAGAHTRRAMALLNRTRDGHLLAFASFCLGELALLEGDPALARRHHERALAWRRGTGEKAELARSLAALSRIALEERRIAEAGRLANQALEAARTAALKDAEASALLCLALVRLAEGHPSEAEESAAAGRSLVAVSARRPLRLSIGIESARIANASGRGNIAREALSTIVREASSSELNRLRLEALLALAELQSASSPNEDSRMRLAAIEKEAEERGLLLIARKASALAAR